MTKPFCLLELLTRVEALLRRARAPSIAAVPASAPLRFGQVEIARRRGRCCGAGKRWR